MTPAARVAAAIGILDSIRDGFAAEQALTRWGRQNRYAGSKDRAAVRDHVFDALRVLRSAQHMGGGTDGRATMIGLLRLQGQDPDVIFTGIAHAPAPLTPQETAFSPGPEPKACAMNLPDWLVSLFEDSLGETALQTAQALQSRAPVTLRVNLRKSSRAAVRSELAASGIVTRVNTLCDTALSVTAGARQLRQSAAYLDGRVELQDAASQAVVALLPDAQKCLDFCAGGGGKALALAARTGRRVYAHDSDPVRMSDIDARARRAGAEIMQLSAVSVQEQAPYDVVLCDAPCSGSGAWRRAAEGKWSLSPERLDALCTVQDGILDQAVRLTAPGGCLVYATCSVLSCENESRVAAFLDRHPAWECTLKKRFDVCDDGDGFFTAHLTYE